MKQIIPFTKDITFKTKIGELSSISLDDDLTLKGEDTIVGNFYIKGSYKMLDTQVAEEEYSYKIPCEIAISDEYDTFDCTIDIDDFYYEIINGEILRVNISLVIDHLARKEIQEEVLVRKITEEDLEKEKVSSLEELMDEVEILEEVPTFEENKKIDILEESEEKEVIRDRKEETDEREVPKEIKREEIKVEKEISKEIRQEEVSNEVSRDDAGMTFDAQLDIMSSTTEETYLTYSVYLFREGDDIDSIITKYGITKDDLADYNDLSNIASGTKLVIPSFMKHD